MGDEWVDELAKLTERVMGFVVGEAVAVRCPECWVVIPVLSDVDKARQRIRHAHDDMGDGGLCIQCGRLHTATVVPSCETCGGPDNSVLSRPHDGVFRHHHCPEFAVVLNG